MTPVSPAAPLSGAPSSGVAAPVVAVILAGGQGRRMGGRDKALLPLAGRPLIAHVVARLAPQVATIAISANGDPARFAAFAAPVLADPADGPPGPRAGLLAGARWALAAHPGALLLSAPCDVPFLPADLVARLAMAPLPVCAAAAGRRHPLLALWRPASLLEVLLAAPAAPAARGGAVRDLFAVLGGGSVDWGDTTPDPFLNVNDPATLALAERSIEAG